MLQSYTSVVGDLSEQLHDLKEELAQSENLRKQQLMEIGTMGVWRNVRSFCDIGEIATIIYRCRR